MFSTELEIESLDERPDYWTLTAPLEWRDGNCTITVPAGFVTDLASIPAALRSVLDVNGRSRRAAVLHDWLYASQLTTRAVADDILRVALVADGMSSAGARVYWLGVRAGGACAWSEHQKKGLFSCFTSVAAYRAWLATLVKAAACILAVLLALPAHAAPPIRPDAKLTPGVTLAVPLSKLCTRGYASSVRHVENSTKAKVYREYGISSHPAGAYEIDHLVSLELGGANDPGNLWPQSYTTRPWNARVKDSLEDRLHALVCSGKVPLAEAQRAIRTDWIAAYRKFVGPMP
jgi:hypothetical protein